VNSVIEKGNEEGGRISARRNVTPMAPKCQKVP
jgi:hypothetical protein